MVTKYFQSVLSKMNFLLGRNPRVIGTKEEKLGKYIPNPYKAVVIISADFELAWAWRYSKAFHNPKHEAITRARISRRNIPIILELCDKYDIPITWATVGHLFLEKCSKNGCLAHPHLNRIPYHESQYWKFDKGDWLDDDPCSEWQTSPEWYAPDLIRMILNAKTKHEIACHTFSHIDCRDSVCSPGVFESEINECRKFEKEYGIEMTSFVHPGHTIGNLDGLAKLGFGSFRTDYGNALGYPLKHLNGLWEFKATAEFYHRREWSIDYHIKRYKNIIERAIRHNRVAYFWFHPTFEECFITKVMEPIFSHILTLKRNNQIAVLLTKDYVNYLNSHCRIQK